MWDVRTVARYKGRLYRYNILSVSHAVHKNVFFCNNDFMKIDIWRFFTFIDVKNGTNNLWRWNWQSSVYTWCTFLRMFVSWTFLLFWGLFSRSSSFLQLAINWTVHSLIVIGFLTTLSSNIKPGQLQLQSPIALWMEYRLYLDLQRHAVYKSRFVYRTNMWFTMWLAIRLFSSMSPW